LIIIKFFTLEKAQERGTLKYYCNLDDLEKIEKYETDEYDDEDLFRLSDQHACVERCIYWYKENRCKEKPAKKDRGFKRKNQQGKKWN